MKLSTWQSLLIVTIFLFCNACGPVVIEKQQSGWKAVYQNDPNGKAIEGNIDSLISGIRNGYDIRVGWGWEKEIGDSLVQLEHMATPIYISILQEKDVSAIIDAHPLLASYLAIDQQKFSAGGHPWQCIMTTQGTFNAQVYDRATDTLIKDWPQRHRITWFVEYPANPGPDRKPLYD